MAKGFDKLHIKSAVRGRTNAKYDKLLLTTMNIGEIVPSHIMELVPSDKVSIHHKTFARLAPMPVPSYVKLFYKTASFFVPFHQVMDGADSFISGQSTFNGNVHHMRHFTLEDLYRLFNNGDISVDATSDSYDWKFIGSNGIEVYAKFTPFGKHVYKVLKNLGYEIPRGIDNRAGSTWVESYKKTKISALPFLCYLKAYSDWMSNSVRYNTSFISSQLYSIKVGRTGTYYDSATGHITWNFIKAALEDVRLNYDTNYFTGAWENPNYPLSQFGNVNEIEYQLTDIAKDTVTANDDYQSVSTYRNFLNDRALAYLQRFSSWIRRNNFVGTKDVELILSRMGVKIDDYKVRFAYRLGMSSTEIHIGDVTATANSMFPTATGQENFAIGDYVGKGILQHDNPYNDSFTSSDYGFYIQIAYIVPRVQYSSGFDRNVLRITPTDFYNPEFDQMQASPIPVMEVGQCNKYRNTPSNDDGTKIFGFMPKYSDYLYQRDVVSGDMILNEGFESWHYNRDLSALLDSPQFVAQSVGFNQIPVGDAEFNRIFDVTDNVEDKFIVASSFVTSANRPMLSLSDKAELGQGDLTISRNGTQLN